jgi:LysM repeat protein
MNHLLISKKWGWTILLVTAVLLAACERSVPEDEMPPTFTPAPIVTAPPTLPTAELPTPEIPQPTLEPTAPPATDATAVPTQPTTGGGQTVHVVAPGDTLYSISLQYGVAVEEIMAANGLSDPNSLTVGQQLIIPAPGSVQPVPPTPPPGGEQIYTVQPGDNLFRIGLQYGCTVDQMSVYNNIPYPYTIYVGDQIRIPPDC